MNKLLKSTLISFFYGMLAIAIIMIFAFSLVGCSIIAYKYGGVLFCISNLVICVLAFPTLTTVIGKLMFRASEK